MEGRDLNAGLLQLSTISMVVPGTQQVLVQDSLGEVRAYAQEALVWPPGSKGRMHSQAQVANRAWHSPCKSLGGQKSLRGKEKIAVFLSFSLLGLICFSSLIRNEAFPHVSFFPVIF